MDEKQFEWLKKRLVKMEDTADRIEGKINALLKMSDLIMNDLVKVKKNTAPHKRQ
jgi:hypothetical protein